MATDPGPVDKTANRRAVEALRAGVPNRDAVSQLGCHHPGIEAKFDSLLGTVTKSLHESTPLRGILISGGFGSGKSHLLQYLQHHAIESGYACSKIVISKETPLYDPAKVFRAAAAELRVPKRSGSGLTNVASALDFGSKEYGKFFHWADPLQSHLAAQFAGSLYVFQNGGDAEFRDRIVRFWSGDKLVNAELKLKLRLLGQGTTYPLQALPRAAELAFQRFQFASRLIAAAGHKGWILLVDEVELIGQYSFKQRARAYAELARWMGQLDDSADGVFPGIGCVLAITSDFESAVITAGKNDKEMVPGKLNASVKDEDHLLATRAERGMRSAMKETTALGQVTAEQVRSTHERLAEIYERSFGWTPPPLLKEPQLDLTSVMRQFVRRWITEWDLKRIYGATPNVVDTPLGQSSYEEDPDLELDEPDGK
ncbi:MAG: DUF2791 family P-loop domain-containing protein [Chloroflexi bacterium]|nr:DUF2791 family P-loop domain-containing protein [Chloroflexota bacterium]